jgi:hypothetical protein
MAFLPASTDWKNMLVGFDTIAAMAQPAKRWQPAQRSRRH